MWIVKIALDRPYTFIVLALLILILSPLVILRTPTDIFPNINIPVIAVVWTYTGLNPEEMEGRITTSYERSLTTLVDNIQHIESTSYNGISVVKIFLQPGASLDTANAQVTAASQLLLRQMPPGTAAAGDPQLQRVQRADPATGLSGDRHVRTAAQRSRPQFPAHPTGHGAGGGRSVSVWRQAAAGDDRLSIRRCCRRRACRRPTCSTRWRQQNLVLPSGTAKICPVRIRRAHQLGATDDRAAQRPADQDRRQRHDLPARRRHRQRRLRAANQHRAPGRPARRAGEHPQGRQRVDDRRGRRHSRDVAARRADAAAATARSGRSPTSRSSSRPRSAA